MYQFTLPIINLTGKWLAETGFQAGHVVDITCEDSRLTITLAREQRFEGVRIKRKARSRISLFSGRER